MTGSTFTGAIRLAEANWARSSVNKSITVNRVITLRPNILISGHTPSKPHSTRAAGYKNSRLCTNRRPRKKRRTPAEAWSVGARRRDPFRQKHEPHEARPKRHAEDNRR